MDLLRPAVGLTAFALLGFAPPDDEGASDGASYKLAHKAHEKWEFILPDEKWHDAADAIELPGGIVFKTKSAGVQKIEIDTNGDGKLDKDVKGNGGFLTLRSETEDGEKIKYSVRLRNVAAGKYSWSTGSSMTGKVAGQVVNVFDQDGNGAYNDYGVDAITIGRSMSASLLSRVVPLDGKLHQFEINEIGTEVKVTPYTGETGTLNAVEEYDARGKLSHAVFRDGDNSFCFAADAKGMEVPAGVYTLVSGKVERGSASAMIRRGRMRPLEVKAGEATKVEWGADVSGEFSFSQTGDKVKVNSDMKFFGTAGEEYYDFMPRGKGPKIVISDAERGKTLKEGRFAES